MKKKHPKQKRFFQNRNIYQFYYGFEDLTLENRSADSLHRSHIPTFHHVCWRSARCWVEIKTSEHSQNPESQKQLLKKTGSGLSHLRRLKQWMLWIIALLHPRFYFLFYFFCMNDELKTCRMKNAGVGLDLKEIQMLRLWDSGKSRREAEIRDCLCLSYLTHDWLTPSHLIKWQNWDVLLENYRWGSFFHENICSHITRVNHCW